jgi:hypothetical protein
MSKQFLSNLALSNLSSDPGSGTTGELYYNTTSSLVRVYNGTAWSSITGGGGGAGTVTSIATGTGLTGGTITTSGTLAIDTTVVPQLSAANTFTGNITAPKFITSGGTSSQFVKGDGTLDTGTLDITTFDDLRYRFDGIESRFVPTYQGTQVAITNPLRLFITINGIVQSIDQSVVVWDSPLKPDGLRVDNDGYLAFSEVVPAGSSFSGRLMPGSSITTVSTTYPFKAADLLIGAF